MSNDTRTLAVIQDKGLLVEGKQIFVDGEFDSAAKEFFVRVDGEELGGVLQCVLSFVRDSGSGENFIPYLELWRQSRPTSGTLERSNVSFSKIKAFRFSVELET